MGILSTVAGRASPSPCFSLSISDGVYLFIAKVSESKQTSDCFPVVQSYPIFLTFVLVLLIKIHGDDPGCLSCLGNIADYPSWASEQFSSGFAATPGMSYKSSS